eukprot:5948025-Lingulodinium_polyedra.AAC.1
MGPWRRGLCRDCRHALRPPGGRDGRPHPPGAALLRPAVLVRREGRRAPVPMLQGSMGPT